MSPAEITLASALRSLIESIVDSDFAADFEEEIASAREAMESCGHDADSVSDDSRSNGPRY